MLFFFFSGISSKLDRLGGSCLFILSLIICDFIDLYSGNIKPMSC